MAHSNAGHTGTYVIKRGNAHIYDGPLLIHVTCPTKPKGSCIIVNMTARAQRIRPPSGYPPQIVD